MSSGSLLTNVFCQIKAIRNAVLGLNHMVLSHVHANKLWLFPTLSSDPCLYAACIILLLGKSISCLFCLTFTNVHTPPPAVSYPDTSTSYLTHSDAFRIWGKITAYIMQIAKHAHSFHVHLPCKLKRSNINMQKLNRNNQYATLPQMHPLRYSYHKFCTSAPNFSSLEDPPCRTLLLVVPLFIVTSSQKHN